MRNIALWIILLSFLSSCTESEQEVTPDPGYAYFPLEAGQYTVYKVDSIYHDQPESNIPGIHDTIHYFLKEVVDEAYEDASGETALRITRFKRTDPDEDWVLTDVWSAKRNAGNAERVEENLRYVKLAFPVSSYATWDANALNILPAWKCHYDSLQTSRTLGDLTFENTLTVMQRDFLTEVNDEYAWEVYAKDAGLIYRYYKRLYTRPSYLNNRVAGNIISGSEYSWEIIAYGIE